MNKREFLKGLLASVSVACALSLTKILIKDKDSALGEYFYANYIPIYNTTYYDTVADKWYTFNKNKWIDTN